MPDRRHQSTGIKHIAALARRYFSRNDGNSAELAPYVYPTGRFMLCSALHRTLRYYLGSVAFGSLLIALLQFVRSIFMYIERRLKKVRRRCNSPTIAQA